MPTEIYMSYFIEFFEKKGLPLNKVSSMVLIVLSFNISHHPLSREYIVSHFSSNYYYYPWIIEDIVIQIFECSFPFF